MVVRPLLAVNMRRRNFAMHALLASNVDDDILCVTEPWFSRIGVARDDALRDGLDVLGGAAHPNWDIHYPYFTTDQRAKVMMYTRRHSRARQRQLIPWRCVVRPDLGRHPCLLIADIHDGPALLRVVTFYNDVDDPSALQALLRLSLPPTVPTILVGDFNLHSPSWSPPDVPRSPGVAAFELWAAPEGLELQTPPGTITHRGPTPERPSTLDLTWHNFMTDHSGSLSPPSYHWDASLGSDHCGVHVWWDAATPLASVPPPLLRTFDPVMDDAATDTWHTILDTVLPLLWPIKDLLTPAAIDTATASLQGVVHDACSMAMKHRRAPGAHAHS